MSLTGPDFWVPERGAVMPVGVGRRCFFCEEPIRKEPAWTWIGGTGQIWLHPGCATDFATRIFADLLPWQKRNAPTLSRGGQVTRYVAVLRDPAPLGGICPARDGVMDETGYRIGGHFVGTSPSGISQVIEVFCAGTPTARIVECPACAT